MIHTMKPRIAILHSDVMGIGGGGLSVCLEIIEALKKRL